MARLYPALLTLVPWSVFLVVFFDPAEWFKSVLLLAVAAGAHVVIMRVARNRGESRQRAWWERIGGNPTAMRLRWSVAKYDDDHRDLHERVEGFTGITLPSRAREEADPDAALRVYSRAVARMRELTRDHGAYPRIWDELKNYGFARNTYGVKKLGLLFAAGWLVVMIVLLIVKLRVGSSVDEWKIFVVGGIDLGAILFWVFGVNFALLERESDRYASALLDAAKAER
jgi:hypothetical protein